MLLHQRLFLNVIATPISGERGEGVLLTLQDVTRLRQVETTRREFVSNVSHELRSPLASVRAMVETLEGGALRDPDVALDFLGRIESDIQRMTTLVDELLELSRLESGQMPVHLAPLSVSEVAGEIVARFEGPAAAAGVKMGIDLPPDLPYVMAETGKLDQILTNLLENALRFTPEGGRVDVSASTGRRWVKLTVSDTGIAYPASTCRTCSSASTRWTGHAGTAAPASVWPLPSTSFRHTAATSASAAPRDRAVRSTSRSSGQRELRRSRSAWVDPRAG